VVHAAGERRRCGSGGARRGLQPLVSLTTVI
jgi:hypothetical protein